MTIFRQIIPRFVSWRKSIITIIMKAWKNCNQKKSHKGFSHYHTHALTRFVQSTAKMKRVLRVVAVVCCLCLCSVVRSGSSEGIGNVRDTDTEISLLESQMTATSPSQLLMVPLTLIQRAGSKGAGTIISLYLSSCSYAISRMFAQMISFTLRCKM